MSIKKLSDCLSWLTVLAIFVAAPILRAQEPKAGGEPATEGRAVAGPRVVPAERPVRMLFGGEQGEYRLGVLCRPADDLVRLQLKLDKNEGLIVDHVIPDSTSAKAGLKQHDIILRAGDKPVADPQALSAAVQAAKDGELKLDILREGERKSLAIKPEKRTGNEQDRVFFFERPAVDMLRHFGETATAELGPIQIRGFGPGMAIGAIPAIPPLPDNVGVSITKQGKVPAQITVKRGEDSWTIKETELDKLPEDLRGPIGALVMHPAPPMGFTVAAPAHPFQIPIPPQGALRTRARHDGDLDERLEQLDERMQDMVEELRDLRRERRAERGAAKRGEPKPWRPADEK